MFGISVARAATGRELAPLANQRDVLPEELHSSSSTAQRRKRRAEISHPNDVSPGLLASMPNRVWSWDITNRKGPAKRTCSQLEVILDD